MKKIAAVLLTAVMAISMVACGGNGGSSTPSGSNESKPAETQAAQEESKTYQFEGKFEEQGEYASMLNNAFFLNLNADGTAVCDKYAFAQFDASDAETNRTYTQSYLSGTWKAVEKDGVPCLQIKLSYKDASGNESNATTSYAYDVAGEYSFDMSYPVTPGQAYTRTAAMTGKEGTLYADDNAFIQAYKQEFVAPENVGTFVDAEKNATAYLQADGTMLIYAGYDKFAEGKWANGADGLTITMNDAAVEVTKDGNAASFKVTRTMGDFTQEYTLTCADVTALPKAE